MAASAPAFLACRVSSIASSVEFEPVPAITGTPVPLAAAMQMSITRLCSSHGERGRFARGAARHQPVRAFLDLPGHELLEALLIDRSVLERGDQRDERPGEHGFLRILLRISQFRPRPLSRQGEQLAIVMPQVAAYDS